MGPRSPFEETSICAFTPFPRAFGPRLGFNHFHSRLLESGRRDFSATHIVRRLAWADLSLYPSRRRRRRSARADHSSATMVEKPTEPTGRSPVARSVPLAEGIRYAPALSAGNAHSKGKVQIGRRHAVGMCPRERRRRANRVDEQAIWSTRGTEQEWPYTGGR